MKPTDKKVIWEGAIQIVEQEGGYAESALSIGDEHPVSQIEDAFEDLVPRLQRTCCDETMDIPGLWRLTLERIE
jgi:hypothetical protein